MALKDEIRNAATELVNKGLNGGPALRKLQRNLDQLQTSDPHKTFLCFFLVNFIDDVYFNLSGDFPYEERTKIIRNDIFKTVGQSLLTLVDELDSNNPCSFYEIYVDMVQNYFDGLTQIENFQVQE